jgi:hypothetical protein
MVGASVAVSPITTDICWRWLPWNSRNTVANTVGIMAPPRKPWQARKTIISPRPVALAQSSENSVKPSALHTNRTRVDRSRDSQPESGIITISAIR